MNDEIPILKHLQKEQLTKLKLFAFSPELLLQLFEVKGEVRQKARIIRGLPEGAIPISVSYDFNTRMFYVAVWHEDFPPVLKGDLIPKSMIEWEVYTLY